MNLKRPSYKNGHLGQDATSAKAFPGHYENPSFTLFAYVKAILFLSALEQRFEGMTGGAAGLAGQSGHATPSLTPVPGSSIVTDSSTISSNLPVKPTVEQQESRLLAYLMQNYDRQVRPLTNHNGNITVHVGITLTQIFDMVSFLSYVDFFWLPFSRKLLTFDMEITG